MTSGTHDSDNLNYQLSRDSQIHFRISFRTNFKSEVYEMKIILNLEFCKKLWKTDIKKVREPNRTKKLREYCRKLVQENKKTLNEQNKLNVHNGIKYFLKSYEETVIEIHEEEDGEFF